ncbi:phage portal protein [Ornithinimicrobium sufpigmenti]|uniref:phage portal protein n=1 Tax=Ornithinimicrobium sufpigmenti TaxID=2508882 RepID=UPI00103591CC|nr:MULTISPECIES: phage portal protein [unclassified Ornithinimicrobium]
MPLPDNGATWPPKDYTDQLATMARWDAWYVGSPDALNKAYSAPAGRTRPSQYAGGLVGAAARLFWGRPVVGNRRPAQLHVPLAADLAQASSDLLYADPPTVTSDDEKTAEALQAYLDDATVQVLAEGAEIGAALGGRYHRVTWDRELADRPFISTVHYDAALPEFRYGRLVAVTFWRVVHRDTTLVVRHLERHELADGIGIVLHGLYQGTADSLGRAIPLTEHASTRHLAQSVNADGALTEGATPGLAVVHVPNMTPNRAWRTHPVGRNLGRSDFDGVEGLMDALDETYTSWMRDVRLARARLIVPEQFLTAHGPGRGASFDLDDEVITPMKMPLAEDGSAQITPQQFAIRVAEHQQTAQDLVEQILRSAGYSAATFGEDEEGAAATATETMARKGRSLLTRGRKVRLERPALQALFTKMLATDVAVFNRSGIDPTKVAVDFGDTVQDSPLQLAQTVEALERAKAVSVETKVRMVHPDWDDDAVTKEVERVTREHSLGALADPASPGLFG